MPESEPPTGLRPIADVVSAGEAMPLRGPANVGQILKRLRLQRGLSLRDVAEAVDLSPSFLSAVEGVEYPVRCGECVVWSAGYPHLLRNDGDEPASGVAMVTESFY